MKVIITGSLGHIGKPLTEILVQQGHAVTVISSNKDRQQLIERMGATAAIGSLEDAPFLAETFTGTDLAYTMVPPANYFDQQLDLFAYYKRLGENYAHAIRKSGVKCVINLSTIGGHLSKGNGILRGANCVEGILNELPVEVSITHIRPTEFYYNLLTQIHSAAKGFIASNIAGHVVNSWVSPIDIADAIAAEINTPFNGRAIRYVASEEMSYNDLAATLGKAIGKPDLKWIQLTDTEFKYGLTAAGMQDAVAEGLTEMYAAINSGLLYEDYTLHKPVPGRIKVKDFANDFAAAYHRL